MKLSIQAFNLVSLWVLTALELGKVHYSSGFRQPKYYVPVGYWVVQKRITNNEYPTENVFFCFRIIFNPRWYRTMNRVRIKIIIYNQIQHNFVNFNQLSCTQFIINWNFILKLLQLHRVVQVKLTLLIEKKKQKTKNSCFFVNFRNMKKYPM